VRSTASVPPGVTATLRTLAEIHDELDQRADQPDTLARVVAIVAQTRKAAGRSSVAGGLEVRRASVESHNRV